MRRTCPALALAIAGLAVPASAEITLHDARLVAAFPNAKAGALYLRIESDDAADLLIGVHAGEAMAMLHETVEEDGVMRMRMVEQVGVSAGSTLALEPGGLHVMIMGLTPEMLEVDHLPVALIFEGAGEIGIEAEVQIGPEDDQDDADDADDQSDG